MSWKALGGLSSALLLAYAIAAGTMGVHPRPVKDTHFQMPSLKSKPASRPIGKPEVRTLIAGSNLLNFAASQVEIRRGDICFTLQTTLDPVLQQFLFQRLDRKNSRYIGIVVMDPLDGRVLVMAGYDKANPDGNPCLDSRFPAASIFKIITAAAAVETRDLEPDSILNFRGGLHTLFKSQIDIHPAKNANRVTLKDSFARSINPVFGKLGALYVGPDVLGAYADAFGFNREIEFELPIRPSRLELSGQTFEVAEIASGFNRTTRISPLHGAIIAAAILNRGRLVEPSVVDWIVNDSGQTIYQRKTEFGDQVIEPGTAKILLELMQATVKSGTAHKEFQKYHGDKILSRLEIGGKTGSMGDGAAETRYDWFVGYARDPHGMGQMVFAVVVAHEDYIGTRAAAYAAMAIKEYFKGHFA
ncbi:MAG: penicillin-binding transpeptidase domain-containing protein, partial [Hyphomicrobiales bacterium]